MAGHSYNRAGATAQPVIPQISIDIIIVGLHFQHKQCDVNNSEITPYYIPAKRCAVGLTGAHLHNRGDRSLVVNTRGDRRAYRSRRRSPRVFSKLQKSSVSGPTAWKTSVTQIPTPLQILNTPRSP